MDQIYVGRSPWLFLIITIADLVNIFNYERIIFRWSLGLLITGLLLWLASRYLIGAFRGHRAPLIVMTRKEEHESS